MRAAAEPSTGHQHTGVRLLLASGAALAMSACGAITSETASTTTVAAPTTPEATTTTTTTAAPVAYRVKRGDSLTAIANLFGLPLAVIVAANHLTNQDQLTAGQLLRIPPAPPVALVITPAEAQPGQAFQLAFTGAKRGETVTFTIVSPEGSYTGPPHAATADGSVTATYQSSPGDPAGVYKVTATGNQGTKAQASLRVDPVSADQTSPPP